MTDNGIIVGFKRHGKVIGAVQLLADDARAKGVAVQPVALSVALIVLGYSLVLSISSA